MDSWKRSLVKSIVWRILGIIVLGVIVFFITGNWEEVTTITLLFHGIQMVLYYFHERIWNNISWGRKSIAAPRG